VDPVLKAEALAFADEHGYRAASERFGIPGGTLRSWKSRGSECVASAAPAGSDLDAVVRKLLRQAEVTHRTAMRCRESADRMLGDGKSTAIRDLSIAQGTFLDQAGKLRAAAKTLEDVRVRLNGEHARLMFAVIDVFLGGLAPRSSSAACRRLLAAIVTAAEGGEALSAPASLAAEAREELRLDLRRMGELALPAPDGDEELEPVDAEVVDPDPVVADDPDDDPVVVAPPQPEYVPEPRHRLAGYQPSISSHIRGGA
jgi:hypothetical protein